MESDALYDTDATFQLGRQPVGAKKWWESGSASTGLTDRKETKVSSTGRSYADDAFDVDGYDITQEERAIADELWLTHGIDWRFSEEVYGKCEWCEQEDMLGELNGSRVCLECAAILA